MRQALAAVLMVTVVSGCDRFGEPPAPARRVFVVNALDVPLDITAEDRAHRDRVLN